MSSEPLSTRHKILETTWKLLENGGAGSVRMADIARAVGISRQALYLHFPNRAELLIATTRYLDEVHEVDVRLAESRAAKTGPERLRAYIDAWGNYIPEIYGVAKALMAIANTDAEANAAWTDRMNAVRHGCAAAVRQLDEDGVLTPAFTMGEATDYLAMLLSVRNWEALCKGAGWSQARYLDAMQDTARRMLIAG